MVTALGLVGIGFVLWRLFVAPLVIMARIRRVERRVDKLIDAIARRPYWPQGGPGEPMPSMGGGGGGGSNVVPLHNNGTRR